MIRIAHLHIPFVMTAYVTQVITYCSYTIVVVIKRHYHYINLIFQSFFLDPISEVFVPPAPIVNEKFTPCNKCYADANGAGEKVRSANLLGKDTNADSSLGNTEEKVECNAIQKEGMRRKNLISETY